MSRSFESFVFCPYMIYCRFLDMWIDIVQDSLFVVVLVYVFFFFFSVSSVSLSFSLISPFPILNVD